MSQTEQLKLALSDRSGRAEETSLPSAPEVSEEIQQLLASHQTEETVDRNTQKTESTAEVPVTTRLKHQLELIVNRSATTPERHHGVESPPAANEDEAPVDPPTRSFATAAPKSKLPQPRPSFREQIAQRQPVSQLSLF